MKIGEKLLNDYLFATTRYLDQHGDKPDSPHLARFFSSPSVKAACITALGGALAYGSMKEYLLATTCVAATFIQPIVSYTVRQRLQDNRPEFYFDTAPVRPQPLKNPAIISTLKDDIRGMYNRFAGFTVGVGISSTTLFAAGVPASQVLTLAAITLAPGAAHHGGLSWRAQQVFKGNWNALPTKPEAETSREKSSIWSSLSALVTAPRPSA